MIEDSSKDPPPLDYATPTARPRFSAPLAAVFGTLAGVFGGLVLFYGVGGIIYLFSGKVPSRDLGGEIFGVVMLNLVGSVSAFFAVRWIRYAFKQARR